MHGVGVTQNLHYITKVGVNTISDIKSTEALSNNSILNRQLSHTS